MSMEIRNLMTPDPAALTSEATILDAALLMRDNDIGDVLVIEDDRLCGILTDRDIVVRALAQGEYPATGKVGDICSREVATVPPSASVSQALELMRSKAIRRLPVVEKDGRVVGIVSLGDLTREAGVQDTLGGICSAEANL